MAKKKAKQYSCGGCFVKCLLIVLIGFIGWVQFDIWKERQRIANMSPQERAAYDAQQAAERERWKAEEEERLKREAASIDPEEKRRSDLKHKINHRADIRPYLDFPDDATFDWYPDEIFLNDGGLLIRGSVEVKNAFGAKLPYKYRAEYDSEGELILLNLGDKLLYQR